MRTLVQMMFIFMVCAVPFAKATDDVSPTAEKCLLRFLLPLPHEITIRKAVAIPAEDIGILVRNGAAEIERNAAEELREFIRSKTGAEPNGKRFQIRIGILDPSLDSTTVQRLEGLPNSAQAYVIRPQGDSGLILSGLDGRGIYYASRTLRQLLEPGVSGKQISIPLAEVTDWPDIDERGLWNFSDAQAWIPWMVSLKLNYGKMVNTRLQTVKRGEPNHAEIDRELMLKARNMAFNYLPFVVHLNFLHGYGLFRAYPELAGKGDSALAGRYFGHKEGNQHRCPCAANPLLAAILAEWMADIAAQGAEETSCWLSERPCQCACPSCTSEGQFVLETRAFLAAWREVQKQYPGFRIRLFISTTDDDRYHKVLAELPPDVKIERACHADLDRVRRLPRDILRNPLFDSYAAEGRWISSYDAPVSVNGLVETPEFKIPQRSAHRIRYFIRQIAERKWQGAYGMLPWGKLGREICGFDIAALAEWAWNLEGRTEREFAEAWAVHEGLDNPEAVGEWSGLMGPVEADVYDSDFPTCYSWGKALQMVKNRQRPVLGEGMFRYYTGPDDFDYKAAQCERSLEIAQKAGYAELINESRITLSYVRLAKQVYLVAEQVSTGDLSQIETQNSLRSALTGLQKAGDENIAAIREWRAALGPEPWHTRVYDALKGTEDTVRGIVNNITFTLLY